MKLKKFITSTVVCALAVISLSGMSVSAAEAPTNEKSFTPLAPAGWNTSTTAQQIYGDAEQEPMLSSTPRAPDGWNDSAAAKLNQSPNIKISESEVITNSINQLVVVQYGKKNGCSASQEEIDQQLNEYENSYPTIYDSALDLFGEDGLRKGIEYRIIYEKTKEYVFDLFWSEHTSVDEQAEVKKIEVTDELITMTVEKDAEIWVMKSSDLGESWSTVQSLQ